MLFQTAEVSALEDFQDARGERPLKKASLASFLPGELGCSGFSCPLSAPQAVRVRGKGAQGCERPQTAPAEVQHTGPRGWWPCHHSVPASSLQDSDASLALQRLPGLMRILILQKGNEREPCTHPSWLELGYRAPHSADSIATARSLLCRVRCLERSCTTKSQDHVGPHLSGALPSRSTGGSARPAW